MLQRAHKHSSPFASTPPHTRQHRGKKIERKASNQSFINILFLRTVLITTSLITKNETLSPNPANKHADDHW